jgi:uncharacterized protein (DUF488 family)
MIYTIGHSKHPIDRFISLLRPQGITAVADVRSTPFSRFNPQFNREKLKQSLAAEGIQYVFLGEELGARSKDRSCYENGRVSYERLARTELFQEGLRRLKAGMADHTIAILCAEKEPLDCHRTILVSKHLAAAGIPVRHILDSGAVEPHEDTLARLRHTLGISDNDMFRSIEQLNEEAYEKQGQRIAYVEK